MEEIRFAGYGGQGIIRCGYIVGTAAAIYDDKYATFNQSFGPEARGGACSAQVVISEEKILYPYITHPNIFVAMYPEAYDKYKSELRDDGMLLFDEDLVEPKGLKGTAKKYSIPATRFAEELGNRIIANVVMLGFFTAVTKVVSYKAMKEAVPRWVPERFIDLNLKALERGYQYGIECLKKEG